METTSKLFSQIAVQAGVSDQTAQLVAYLIDLSAAGKTLNQAAGLIRKDRAFVRDIARDWGLSFADYSFSKPVILNWTKPRRGEWELSFDGSVIARVNSEVSGGTRFYVARWQRDDASIREDGSSAEIAARRLSIEIDRRSIDLFSVDDIEIIFPLPRDTAIRLAPKIADNLPKLRTALSA